MNNINLKGILKNIQYSHNIGDIEYDKATLLVARDNGKEDLIELKFKRFSNIYNENDEIEIRGNIRTYSQKLEDRNRVNVYVFTYFDRPEEEIPEGYNSNSYCEIDGTICKKNELRKTMKGKDVLDFIVANNIMTNTQYLNCYLPCVAWGKCAKALNNLQVGDKIKIKGSLQSREYKKKISDEDFELRIAHEISVNTFEKV